MRLRNLKVAGANLRMQFVHLQRENDEKQLAFWPHAIPQGTLQGILGIPQGIRCLLLAPLPSSLRLWSLAWRCPDNHPRHRQGSTEFLGSESRKPRGWQNLQGKSCNYCRKDVGLAIINQYKPPIFDGLYQPLMVIGGWFIIAIPTFFMLGTCLCGQGFMKPLNFQWGQATEERAVIGSWEWIRNARRPHQGRARCISIRQLPWHHSPTCPDQFPADGGWPGTDH